MAELSFWHPEHDAVVEHGDAEAGDRAPESERVTHRIEGPSDDTAVLALFGRRYRDLRGDEPPYGSRDPG